MPLHGLLRLLVLRVSLHQSRAGLLLASGRAGSLRGALDDTGKVLVSTLFLPPPGMALMVSTLHDEWSYTDYSPIGFK